MSSSDQRETKAFEMLVRENSRMLMTYLRSLVSDEAAVDDLFQETMVVAWRRMDDCNLTREACKKRLQWARRSIADCLKRKGLLMIEGLIA